MTVPGSFPKMWRSWGDGKKIVAILDLSLLFFKWGSGGSRVAPAAKLVLILSTVEGEEGMHMRAL